MVDIYLADIRIYDEGAEGPPRADTALTGGTDIRVWPTSGVTDNQLPRNGDYILFFKSDQEVDRWTEFIGVGQAFETTQESAAYGLLDEAGIPYDESDSVLTIVNYQQPKYTEYITNIVSDGAELARGLALRRVPSSIVEENNLSQPLRRLSQIEGIRVSGFEQSPLKPNNWDRGPPPEDGGGDGNGDGIDRTGPLLEQQYTSRDAIREAAKGSLQISILLFGVIVAGLSFLRDSIESGQLSISEWMFAGAAGIAVAAIFSGAVIVVTTSTPRPETTSIRQSQQEINEVLHSDKDVDKGGALLGFSDVYHRGVAEIQESNALLGGLTGGAVGTSLAGIFVIGYEVVRQISALPWYLPWSIVVLGMAAILLTFFAIWQAIGEQQPLIGG